MSNDERILIEEGSAIRDINESSHDASVWIQDTIDKLNLFRQRVDSGHVIIVDGDHSKTHPVPDREQATYDYISLSIDFVEIRFRNMIEQQMEMGTNMPPIKLF